MKLFSEKQLQNNNKENIQDLIKPPDGVEIIIYSNAASWNISLIPIEEISKTVKETGTSFD